MKKIKIPRKNTQISNMRLERGYVSIKNRKLSYYHKFFYKEDFTRWLIKEEVKCWWGETVYEILQSSKDKTSLQL